MTDTHHESGGYEVTAVIHDDRATSGEAYETYTVTEAESEEEAKDIVLNESPAIRVDTVIEFERMEDGRRVY